MTVATILLSKVVLATTIAGLAEVARRSTRRPDLAYALWATVLAVLVVPSLITIHVPGWANVASDSLSRTPFASVSLGVLGCCWFLGGGYVLWRQWRSLRLLGRLVRFAAAGPPRLVKRNASIANELGIRNCPTVITPSGLFSPFLWHPFFGTAKIVIPRELIEQFTSESIDAILRHELVHFRRRDAWRRRLEILVLAIWWWFPTTWIARIRLRELEELCTDGEVLRANPRGAQVYARTLLDTDEFLARSTLPDLLVVSSFARCGSLPTRIARILADRPTTMTKTSRVMVAGAALMMLVCGLVTAGIAPQESQPDTPVAQVPVNGARRQPNLPDCESVTVHNSDREIVLTWSNEDNAVAHQTIRLLRVSEDGVEPRLWSIVDEHDAPSGGWRFDQREVAWIFAFLNGNNDIIDCDGTRHRHPGLVRLSQHHKELEGCTENDAAA